MTDGNGIQAYMPVAPTAGGMGNFGDGMFGGNGAWWIVLFMIFGGWGNRGWGGNGGSEVQRGFDQSAIMNALNNLSTAVTNGNFAMQNAFQNCCCENRLGISDLKYTIANEAATTRAANASGTQQIMDKLCQLELDGVRQNYEGQIRALQNQLEAQRTENQSLRFAASQGAQTAQVLADNAAQTYALEQYLSPTPRPAYIVQNPNCCTQNWGCNCGAA